MGGTCTAPVRRGWWRIWASPAPAERLPSISPAERESVCERGRDTGAQQPVYELTDQCHLGLRHPKVSRGRESERERCTRRPSVSRDGPSLQVLACPPFLPTANPLHNERKTLPEAVSTSRVETLTDLSFQPTALLLVWGEQVSLLVSSIGKVVSQCGRGSPGLSAKITDSQGFSRAKPTRRQAWAHLVIPRGGDQVVLRGVEAQRRDTIRPRVGHLKEPGSGVSSRPHAL
jgi:hypothetical protein